MKSYGRVFYHFPFIVQNDALLYAYNLHWCCCFFSWQFHPFLSTNQGEVYQFPILREDYRKEVVGDGVDVSDPMCEIVCRVYMFQSTKC